VQECKIKKNKLLDYVNASEQRMQECKIKKNKLLDYVNARSLLDYVNALYINSHTHIYINSHIHIDKPHKLKFLIQDFGIFRIIGAEANRAWSHSHL
jgi:hypothetical protein